MLSPKAEAEATSPTGSPLPCRERTPQREVLQRTYQSGAISNSSSSLKAPFSDCDAGEAGSVTSSVRELQRDRSRARQYVALMRALNSNKTKVVNRGWLRDFLVSMKRRTVLSPFKLQPHGSRMGQLQSDDQATPGSRARQASARQGSMGVGAAIEEGEEGEEEEAPYPDPEGDDPDAQHMNGWAGEADEAVADLSEEEDSLLIEVEQRLEAVQTPEELDQVLDQMLTGLPEAMKSRLRQMTRFTAARQLKMLAALDPDGYYQNAQVESMLQRLKDSQAGQKEGQQDHSWDRTAIKAATALLLTDYDKRHAAAVAIQRAFRRFRAKCEAKGWPSEGRLARLQDLQQLATRFQEEADARLKLGIMRIPKAGASTAYMLRGDREYRSLLLGNSFVVREEQEQEAVQLSAVEVAARKLADLWLSDKPMEKARAAMQGMQLPKRLSNSGAGAAGAQEALRKLLFTDSMKLIEKIAMAGGDEEMVDAMMKEVKQMADEISSATEGETTGVAPRSRRLSFLEEESEEEEEFTRRKSRSARSAPGSRCRRRSSANGSDTGGADDGWLVRRGRGASAGPGKRGSRSKGSRRKGDSDRRQKDHDARTSTAPAQASGEHRRSAGKFTPALNTGLPALRAARSKGKSRFQVAPQLAPSGETDADVSRCWLPQLRLADPGPGLKGSAWGSGLSGAAAWAAAYLRQDGGGAGAWPQTGSGFGVGGLPDAADVQLLVRADARPGSEGVPGSILRDRFGGAWVPLQTVAGASCGAGAAGQGSATDDAAEISGSPPAGMGSSMRRSSGASVGTDGGNPSAGSKLGGGAWLRRPRAPPELGIRAHSLAADSLGPEPPGSPGAGPSPAVTRSHSPGPCSGMGVGGARLRLGQRGDPNLSASLKLLRSGPTGSPLSCSVDVAALGTGAGSLPNPVAGLPLTRLSPRLGMGERRRASGGDALLSPVSPQPASEASQPFQPYTPHPPPGRSLGQQLPQRAPEGPHTLRVSSEKRGEGGMHDGRGSGTVPLAMGEAGDTPVRAVHPAAPRRSHPGGVSISIELAGLQPSACGSIRPGSSDGRQVGAMPYEFRTSVNRPGSSNRPRSPPQRLSMTGGSPSVTTGAGLPPRPFSRSTCGGQADGPSVTPWVRGHQLGPEYSGTLAAGSSSIDLDPQLASAQPQPPFNQQVARLRDTERAAVPPCTADRSLATALADISSDYPTTAVLNGGIDSSGGGSEPQVDTGSGNRGIAAKYGRRPAARQGLVKRSASAATLDPGMVPTPPTALHAVPLPVQASAGTYPATSPYSVSSAHDVTGTLNMHTPLPTSNQTPQLLRPAPIFASSPPASALAPSTKLYKVTALLQAYSTSKLGPSPVAAGGALGAGGLALRMPQRSSGNGLVSMQAVTSRSTSSLPVIQAAQH